LSIFTPTPTPPQKNMKPPQAGRILFSLLWALPVSPHANRYGCLTVLMVTAVVSWALPSAGHGTKCLHKLFLPCAILLHAVM
jgi:hypothetical protein